MTLSTGLALVDVRRRRALSGASETGLSCGDLALLGSTAALASAPFVACALVRLAAFGRLAPLSLLAKPSDLNHGLAYAGAASVFTVAPLVACAPVALVRERGPALAIALAAAAHLVAVCVVGGDWMPYARLVAPIVPSVLYAFVLASSHGRPWVGLARALAGLALALVLFPAHVAKLRRAGLDRRALVEAAAPTAGELGRIAAVDIGWVAAVTESDVIDLAGVTDPSVAVLPGGHTSKRLDTAFLLARSPDTVLIYADPLPLDVDGLGRSSVPRVVEARLVEDEAFRRHFTPVRSLRLGGGRGGLRGVHKIIRGSTASAMSPR